jgi:uncharacterized protein with HEPN domain
MNKKLRRLPDWIEDIRGAIRNINEDIKGLTKGQFLDDGKSQRAVAKSVSDIGEAAHRIMDLAPDIAHRNPEIWKHFVGVYRSRNMLVHDYFLIDAAIVWDTIENYIPQLEALLDTVVFENDGGEDGSGGDIAGGASPQQ